MKISVYSLFCDRICNVEDFYKLEINFVFQNLYYLFHYLINKILGFGVDFSTLLFSLENWKCSNMHAGMRGDCCCCCKAAYLSAGGFLWKRLWR